MSFVAWLSHKEGIVLRLSVIIPTIDEYEDIKRVIEQIYDSCDHHDIEEIILVHSKQSQTDYIAYLHSLPEKFPEIKIVVMCQNRPGVNAAVYEGFCSACGDHVLAIGADMENDPRSISEMIFAAKQHPDAIITASRRLRRGDFANYPPIKRVFNIVFQSFLHIVFKTKQSDITYMYQCTSKKLLSEYDFSDKTDTFILSLALLPEICDIPFFEVPSTLGKRVNGHSHLKLSYYFSFIKAVTEAFRSNKKR